MADHHIDDGIQHGIDDNPNDDAAKGAAIGGIGGAAVGAAAGSMMGPVGAVIGAAVGGLAGAAASGAAVAAVDQADNDNNVTGLGDDIAYENDDDDDDLIDTNDPNYVGRTYAGVAVPPTTMPATDDAYAYRTANRDADTLAGTPYATNTPVEDTFGGNRIPGVQTGGHATDGTPDTRGIMEKTADAVTGDKTDDKTGKTVW